MRECSRCGSCFDDTRDTCPNDSTETVPAFTGPPLIDRKYQLHRRIARGGMGIVYEATHAGLGKRVAIKLIDHEQIMFDPTFVSRFEREAAALGQLEHPHIVTATDYGVDLRDDRSLPYLVMSYVEGPTLLATYSRRGKLALDEAVAVLRQVASALDFAHARGILHLDVKPANIAMERIGDKSSVRVLDFGLARLLHRDDVLSTSDVPLELSPPRPDDATVPIIAKRSLATSSSFIGGTVGYIAPELMRGEAPTPAADTYALGVMAFEILTGVHPDDRPAKEAGRALPDVVRKVIEKAMSNDPLRRPGTAVEFVDGLADAARGASRSAWRRREWPRRAAVAAVLSAVIGLASVPAQRSARIQSIEERLVDFRAWLAPRRPWDPRIAVVVFDEKSSRSDARALVDMSESFADSMQRVIDDGATAVAIDFLLPERWSRSQRFSDFVLANSDRLTLAAYSANGQVTGPESVSGLTAVALGERAGTLFGLVNLEPSSDGMIRRGRLGFAAAGDIVPSFAERSVSRIVKSVPASRSFWLDPRVDAAAADRTSWIDLARGKTRRGHFSGKVVFFGGEYAGSNDDVHRILHRRGSAAHASGVVVQALAAHTILASEPIRDTPLLLTPFLTFVLALGPAFLLLALAARRVATLCFVALLITYTAVATAIFVFRGSVVPIVVPIAGASVALAAAEMVRRKVMPIGGEA